MSVLNLQLAASISLFQVAECTAGTQCAIFVLCLRLSLSVHNVVVLTRKGFITFIVVLVENFVLDFVHCHFLLKPQIFGIFLLISSGIYVENNVLAAMLCYISTLCLGITNKCINFY
jgi:hypothetical protein